MYARAICGLTLHARHAPICARSSKGDPAPNAQPREMVMGHEAIVSLGLRGDLGGTQRRRLKNPKSYHMSLSYGIAYPLDSKVGGILVTLVFSVSSNYHST